MEWDIALPIILSVSVPEVALLLTTGCRGKTERRFLHEKRRNKEAVLEPEQSLKPLPEMQEDSHFFVQLRQREASVPAI